MLVVFCVIMLCKLFEIVENKFFKVISSDMSLSLEISKDIIVAIINILSQQKLSIHLIMLKVAK